MTEPRDTLQPDSIYADLKQHVDLLHGLLSDPHPGLWTWTKAVASECAEITDLYCGPNYTFRVNASRLGERNAR